jgi:tetratricopeptide (TPR) repeat protein
MKTKLTDTEKVVELLKKLPELEAPPGITDGVMERIQSPKKSFWQRFLGCLAAPRQFTIQPMRLAAASALATAIFGLGMLTGMEGNTPVGQPEHINIVEKVLHDNEASFLVGRGLLAAGLPEQALPLLQKASLSAPDNPEYAYWEGLCFWANGRPEKERSSYARGISSSPDTMPLLINLGHNLLEQGELDAALVQYNKVLAIDPREQATLYNRGLIYHLQQDFDNEAIAWKTYLQYHRFGEKSFRAVKRLNSLNDFTYRTYQLGNRRTILSQSSLLSILPTSEVDNHEVEILAHRLRNDPTLQIDIVVFRENESKTARENAKLIKKSIIALLGEGEEERVRLSWFGEKETVKTPNGTHQLPESLLLFGRHNTTEKKETEI